MGKLSMRSHLTIAFAIMAMIPILVLGGFQVYQINNITKEYNEIQKQTTYRLADAVQAYMYYHRNAVETLATTISASDARFRTKDSLTVKLQSLEENLEGFSGLFVVGKQGRIMALYGAAAPNLLEADLSDRAYTKDLVASQKTVLSSVFRGPESANKPALAIAVPIYDEGKQFDGFVLAVLDVAPIARIVTKYEYGSEAYPVVLDHSGRVILHPNKELMDSMADLSQEQAIKDAARLGKGTGIYELNSSSQRELITYKSIPEIGWTVWVSRSYASVNAAFMDSLKLTLMLLVVTLLLTIVLGSLLAKRLNSTIHSLMEYIQRLTGGNFSKPDKQAAARGVPLEHQVLAKHFFRMAGQIKENQHALMELNAELESRVEERTERLFRKNQELEIVNMLLIPSTLERAAGDHIKEGIAHLSELIQAKVTLHLHPHTDASALGSFIGWGGATTSDQITVPNTDGFQIAVQAGNLALGQLVVKPEQEGRGAKGNDVNSNQDPSTNPDLVFLQTFSNTIGIIIQNDILVRSTLHEHATFNAVLESMSDAVVLIDMEQQVVYANHRMSELLDIEMIELGSMTESSLFTRISSMLTERHEDLLTLTAQSSVQTTLKMTNKQGKECFMRVSAFEVAGEDRLFGRGYVWRDMTKEHEIDALKNDLISLASHEFKTPITSIRGGVETLLRAEANWEESFKQELLEGIHEDIGRIQDLIDEWLDISKIEAGAMRINPRPLLVQSIVESARRRLPQQESYEHTKFDLRLDPDLPLIYADKLRMEQVLVNLFTNAIRYNDNEPVISITADADEAYVHLYIRDNGTGIPEEHLNKIFDRFYRVDLSSSRQTGGTGLGLAICRGIMEAHGGQIRVESKLESGSTFIVSVPKYQGEERE